MILDDCFENDTGFEGNDINTDGMVIETGNKYAEEFDGNSATDCQQLCQSVDNCLYFTFKNGENVKRCFLKNSDGGRMESENKISGPKNCPGRYKLPETIKCIISDFKESFVKQKTHDY